MVGRMLKWSLELSKFDIRYEIKKALKAQALSEFMAEMTPLISPMSGARKWSIFVDEASSSTGSGDSVILKSEEGKIVEVSMTLSFPISNNQAEYKAFLVGLRLAEDLGAEEVRIYTDSQLVSSQVRGKYQVKNNHLSEYWTLSKPK